MPLLADAMRQGRRPGAVLRRPLQGAAESVCGPLPTSGCPSRRCTTRTATRPSSELRATAPPQTLFVTADGRIAGHKVGEIKSQDELDAPGRSATSAWRCEPGADGVRRPAGLAATAGRGRRARPARAAQQLPAAGRGGRESAVLMLFGEAARLEAARDVLLIERAHDMRSHAGQVAFPGGAVDPGDEDEVAAALREAVEETGLDPAGVDVFGTLPALFLPPSGFVVTPVLGWWREPSPVSVVDPREVASVHRVPLAELLDPANRLRVQPPERLRRRRVRRGRSAGVGLHRGPARPDAAAGRLGAAVGPHRRPRPARRALAGDPAGRGGGAPVNWLDLVLLVSAVSFAFSGYRQGFVVGVLAFAGFLGGGVVGLLARAALVDAGRVRRRADAARRRHRAAGRTIGQIALGLARRVVRDRITWRPARVVDAGLGAAVSVVAMLVVAWFLASALRPGPLRRCRAQISDSHVVPAVDQVMPEQASTLFSSFRRVLDDNGLPTVFGGLSPERIRPVARPTARSPAPQRIRRAARQHREDQRHGDVCSRQPRRQRLRLRPAARPDQRPRRRRGRRARRCASSGVGRQLRRPGGRLRPGSRPRGALRARPDARPRWHFDDTARSAATRPWSPASRRGPVPAGARPGSATRSTRAARTSTTARQVDPRGLLAVRRRRARQLRRPAAHARRRGVRRGLRQVAGRREHRLRAHRRRGAPVAQAGRAADPRSPPAPAPERDSHGSAARARQGARRLAVGRPAPSARARAAATRPATSISYGGAPAYGAMRAAPAAAGCARRCGCRGAGGSARPRAGPGPATGRARRRARPSRCPRAPRGRGTAGRRRAGAGPRSGTPPVEAPSRRGPAPRRSAPCGSGRPSPSRGRALRARPAGVPVARPCRRSPVRLRVVEPADQLRVERSRVLLVREVPDAGQQAPAVGRLDVAARTLRAARRARTGPARRARAGWARSTGLASGGRSATRRGAGASAAPSGRTRARCARPRGSAPPAGSGPRSPRPASPARPSRAGVRRRAASSATSWRSGTTAPGSRGRAGWPGPVGLGEVRPAQPPGVRHRHRHQAAHLPGCTTDGPGDQAAPAVPDDDGVPRAQRPDHPGDVLGEGARVVAARRLVAGAVAAQVHRGGAVARRRPARAAGAARPTRTPGSRAGTGRAGRRRPRRRGSGRRWPRPCGAPTARRRGRRRRRALVVVGVSAFADRGCLRNAAVSLLVRIVRSGGPTLETAFLPPGRARRRPPGRPPRR